MARMSNRERIARAAEEARLKAVDKAEKPAKKASKSASTLTPKRSAKNVRMKIVWEVCNGNGTVVKTFAYPERSEAELATGALTRSTGKAHIVRATKVPME
jgi:hypothetical protein